MTIKCSNCGKHYNFDTDEICPNCGEYTRPNKRYSPQKERQNRSFEYNEPRKQVKRDFDRPSSKQISGKYTQKQRNDNDEDKTGKKPKGIATIIPFIVVILSMFPSIIGDVFDDNGNDFPLSDSEQVDTYTEIGSPIISLKYFEDTVTTNIAEYTINSVYEVEQNYESYDRIIAVDLSSKLNDDVYSQFELNDIYIEYTMGDDGDIFQSFDIFNYSDSIPEIYSEINHYDIFSHNSEDYSEGTLLFQIPKDIENFSIVIEESEYDYSSNNPKVSEIYRYCSDFGY